MSTRVFAPPPITVGQAVVLSEQESHYLLRVRRARPGDEVDVLDGVSAAYRGQVASIVAPRARGTAASVTIEITERLQVASPAPVNVGLAIVEPKATLDAITSACEAGAATLTMLQCQFSHHAVPSSQRIDRVVQAAMRQCGRPTPLHVEGPVPVLEWLERSDSRPGFVASLNPNGGGASPNASSGARLLVGPEGGLTQAEEQAALAHEFTPISLGPWVLRAPNAVLAGVVRILCS